MSEVCENPYPCRRGAVLEAPCWVAILSSSRSSCLVGGTAACVVAARLADADPNISILIIEGGPDNSDRPSLEYPAFLLAQIMPDSKVTNFYKGNQSVHLDGRELIVPAGGVLGGGSSINFMQYSRGQRSDFDGWNIPGWSTDELLPYLKKVSQSFPRAGAEIDLL